MLKLTKTKRKELRRTHRLVTQDSGDKQWIPKPLTYKEMRASLGAAKIMKFLDRVIPEAKPVEQPQKTWRDMIRNLFPEPV